MATESGTIKRVEWLEVIPALRLAKAAWIALTPSILALAFLGYLVSSIGWQAASLILTREERFQLTLTTEFELDDYVPAWNTFTLDGPVEYVIRHTAGRVAMLGRIDLSWRGVLYFMIGNLWAIGVWSLVGGTICRYSVLKLGAEESPDIFACARMVFARWLSFFTAPLYPLLGVALLTLPLAIAGLLMRADLGVLIMGLLWVVVLLVSAVIAWLLVGLFFGWILMWPAISAEQEGDTFDAFSRSYSYVFGKPVHYAFYLVVAGLVGWFALELVEYVAAVETRAGFWGTSWGAGRQRTLEIQALVGDYQRSFQLDGAPPKLNSSEHIGAWLISWSIAIVRAVPRSFAYAFFFVAASGIYLLLRKDVDDKELDDLYHEDDAARFAAGRRAVSVGVPSASSDVNNEGE